LGVLDITGGGSSGYLSHFLTFVFLLYIIYLLCGFLRSEALGVVWTGQDRMMRYLKMDFLLYISLLLLRACAHCLVLHIIASPIMSTSFAMFQLCVPNICLECRTPISWCRHSFMHACKSRVRIQTFRIWTLWTPGKILWKLSGRVYRRPEPRQEICSF